MIASPERRGMIAAVKSGIAVLDGKELRFIADISHVASNYRGLRNPQVARLFGVTPGRGQPSSGLRTEGMCEAVRSFIWRGDRFIAGMTRVSPDHPVLLEHARDFRASDPTTRARLARLLDRHTSQNQPASAEKTAPRRPAEIGRQRRHKLARHEAAHAVAAIALGWNVHAVRLHEGGGGKALIIPPRSRSRGQELRERAVAALIGPLMGGWEPADRRADGGDVAVVNEALDRLTRTAWDRQCLRDAFKAEAATLAADPQFRRRVSTVAGELEERGELTGDHVRRLIQGKELPPKEEPAWRLTG